MRFLSLVAMLVVVALLPAAASAGTPVSAPAPAKAPSPAAVAPATAAAPAAAVAMQPAPEIALLGRKLAENSHRITQISRGLPKIGSLVVAARKGGVVGDVVQLPLVQLVAVNTGDTLDKYIIASSRKGYLFSWPDGGKLYFGGGHYFAGAGCSGQAYVRYEFLPLASQYLGAVFVDEGKVVMVPPRGQGEVVVRSFHDGEKCADAQESGNAFGAVLPNAPSLTGIPNVASFADDFRLGVD